MPYSILWPSYMNHAVWQDLGKAIDTTFDSSVNSFHTALKWIRTTYIPSDSVASATKNKTLIDYSMWNTYEQALDIQRLNFMGLVISEPDILRSEDTSRLVQNIGAYWFEKGKANFIDFIGYCLNTQVSLQKLWTTDYVTFVPEGSSSIGATIYNGGSWYPTTHVRLFFDTSRFTTSDVNKVVKLFYDISPYNLVLESVVSTQTLPVVTVGTTLPDSIGPVPMPIFKIGCISAVTQYCSSGIAGQDPVNLALNV